MKKKHNKGANSNYVLKRTFSILKNIRGEVLPVPPCDCDLLFSELIEIKYKDALLETFLGANTFFTFLFMNIFDNNI